MDTGIFFGFLLVVVLLFCLTALITPNGTPNITAKVSANPASLAVIGIRGAISCSAGFSET